MSYEKVQAQERAENIAPNHIQLCFWKHSNSPEDMHALDLLEDEIIDFAEKNPEKQIEIVIDHIHTPYKVIEEFKFDQESLSPTDAYVKLLLKDPIAPKGLSFEQGKAMVLNIWNTRQQFHRKTFEIMDRLQTRLGKERFVVNLEGVPNDYEVSQSGYSKSKEVLFVPEQFKDLMQNLLEESVGSAFQYWKEFVNSFSSFTKSRETALAQKTKFILEDQQEDKAFFFLFGDSHIGLRKQLEVLPKDSLSLGYEFLGKENTINYDPFTAVVLSKMYNENPLTDLQEFNYFIAFLSQCKLVERKFGEFNNDNYETDLAIWDKLKDHSNEITQIFTQYSTGQLDTKELLAFVNIL